MLKNERAEPVRPSNWLIWACVPGRPNFFPHSRIPFRPLCSRYVFKFITNSFLDEFLTWKFPRVDYFGPASRNNFGRTTFLGVYVSTLLILDAEVIIEGESDNSS